MAQAGGFFRGKSFRSEGDPPETERAFAILWGVVVGQPQDRTYKVRKVAFSVKYHSQKSYMRCEAYGDTDALTVMAAMERGDTVFCLGTWKREIIHTKTGDKPVYAMRCDFIIPMALIAYLLQMYASHNFRAMLEQEAGEPEDPHSWDDDDDLI